MIADKQGMRALFLPAMSGIVALLGCALKQPSTLLLIACLWRKKGLKTMSTYNKNYISREVAFKDYSRFVPISEIGFGHLINALLSSKVVWQAYKTMSELEFVTMAANCDGYVLGIVAAKYLYNHLSLKNLLQFE